MLQTALSVVAGGIIIYWGAVLHELTHAAAGWLLGGSIRRVDIVQLFVDVEIEPGWRRRLMLLAPGIVGLLLTPGAVAVAFSDADLLLRGAIVGAWAFYTFNGGTQGELSLRPAPSTEV